MNISINVTNWSKLLKCIRSTYYEKYQHKKQNKQKITDIYWSLYLYVISSVSLNQIAESIRYHLQHGFYKELCKDVSTSRIVCSSYLRIEGDREYTLTHPKEKSHMGWYHMTQQAIQEVLCVQATVLEIHRWGSGEQLSRSVAVPRPAWRSCLDLDRCHES